MPVAVARANLIFCAQPLSGTITHQGLRSVELCSAQEGGFWELIALSLPDWAVSVHWLCLLLYKKSKLAPAGNPSIWEVNLGYTASNKTKQTKMKQNKTKPKTNASKQKNPD